MPTWAKVLLFIVVAMITLVAGCAGVGYYWWSHNKDQLFARGKAVFEAGRTAGQLTDNKGCLDQSVTRYKAGPGLTHSISTGIFMQSCLETSRPTPGFCDGVPKPTDFLKVGPWRRAKCESVGLRTDPFCQSLFQGVERFCAEHNR